MRPVRKGSFWDQPTDAAMYQFLLKGLAVGVVLGVIAWFVGHGLLRALIRQ